MKDRDSCGGPDRERRDREQGKQLQAYTGRRAIRFAFHVPGSGVPQRLRGMFAHACARLLPMLGFSMFLMQAALAESYPWGTDPARWVGISKPYNKATGVALLVSSSAELAQETAGIRLRSRDLSVTPNREDGLRAITAIPEGASRQVIVKLDYTPNPEERKSLAVSGIRLLQYIGNGGWFASVRGPFTVVSPQLARVQGAWAIEPGDRLSPDLKRDEFPEYLVMPDGQVRLNVLAFEGANLDALAGQIAAWGGIIDYHDRFSHVLRIRLPRSFLQQLSTMDAVHWIEPAAAGAAPELDRARSYVNNHLVQATPYNLRGVGVEVSVHDGGHALQHPDFSTRWVHGDASTEPLAIHWHATRTAGNIAGDGLVSTQLPSMPLKSGMAPRATIWTYSFGGYFSDFDEANLFGDLANALQINDVEVANNSWGFSDCNTNPYGHYSLQASLFDYTVLNPWGGKPAVVVFSAGNTRDGYEDEKGTTYTDCIDNPWPPFINYGTINQPKAAKNPIVVGATDSFLQSQLTTYSAWGPVSDGRLKPDIVVGGQHNNVGYLSPSEDGGYDFWGATSAAASTVSGNAAIFIEDFRYLNFGSDPLPSTVKAHFLHTAADLDDSMTWYNKGPDYASGYGVLDIKAAIDQLRSGAWQEACVGHTESNNLTFFVPENTPVIKFTLAWDDPEASPAVNPLDPARINDLDLVVTDPVGSRHYPWTLDPDLPAVPAVRNQADHINNVEMVLVDDAVISGYWTVQVTGTDVPEGPQCYSLVYSGDITGWTDATTDILTGPGSMNGVAWGDYQNDGSVDLYFSKANVVNELHFNMGNGQFGNATGVPGNPVADPGYGYGVAWADYDNDGDLDLYLSNHQTANRLFQNDGSGGFVDVATGVVADAGAGGSVNWVDYDNDGLVDLYLSWVGRLLRNLGDGNFMDVSSASGLENATSSRAAWSDYDNDGDQDVYMTNGGSFSSNVLYQNNGDGTFTDVTYSSGPIDIIGESRGIAWGDYDNDGHMDLYVTESSEGNRLFHNQGNGTFVDVTAASGTDGLASDRDAGWADYDNDGDLDLYVANGRGVAAQANALYRNNGDGTFANVTNISGPLGYVRGATGMAWADYDDDGDVDLFVASNDADGYSASKLYRNDLANDNNWLHLDLVGTCSNRSAIGARVYLVSGGITQMRDISGGSAYFSQDSLTVEFGLGSQTSYSLFIRWPSGIQHGGAAPANIRFPISEPPCDVADLAVAKYDSPDPVILGDETITYTVTVTNNGPDFATNVRWTDTLPMWVTLESVTVDEGSCTPDFSVPQHVRCHADQLCPSCSIHAEFVVTPSTAGTLTNSVQVQANQDDPVTANNTAATSTTVIEGLDLQLTKVDLQDPVAAGFEIEYRIEVTNPEPRAATNVRLTDTLPVGLVYVSAQPDQGSCRWLPPRALSCNLGPLGAGSVAGVVLRARADTAGVYTNTASITATEPDPDPSNNTASESTTVEPDSDADGVMDSQDNCIMVPNTDQRDTDGDGYGNLCDGDLNNDGSTNTLDLNLYKQAHRAVVGDANYNVDADFNGDGRINTLDLNIYKGLHRKLPGPSCCGSF